MVERSGRSTTGIKNFNTDMLVFDLVWFGAAQVQGTQEYVNGTFITQTSFYSTKQKLFPQRRDHRRRVLSIPTSSTASTLTLLRVQAAVV